MAKLRKRRIRNTESPAPPLPAPPAALGGGRPSPARWKSGVSRAAGFAGALLLLAWCALCLRACQHYGAGQEAERTGNAAEAAREYEAALGACAPLNPYCGAAAERMTDLARRTAEKDPLLAEEIRDRLLRALRGSRWLFQPHGNLLVAAGAAGGVPPRDPRGTVFLLACVALALGLGAWWTPWSLRVRATSGAAGLAAWALLLYLC